MFRGAGLAIIHTDEKNNHSVLLGKSNNYNNWNFPGGSREADETPVQTAYREFVEEVFNVHATKDMIDEIISLIEKDDKCFRINTYTSDNKDIPSYTFLQKDVCITTMVNTLIKYNIYSNVFNIKKFKKSNKMDYYENLFDSNKQVNIYNFCSMRRYITEKPHNSMNEIVFIIMIPLKNILLTLSKHETHHYHFEYLKLIVPSIYIKINDLLHNQKLLNNVIIDPELLQLERLLII